MPNGGSDCCGTCWFNAKNKGEAGYDHADSPEPDHCIIRDLPIENPFYTYCANHPHHNPQKINVPIGPVFINERRDIWVEAPDSAEIRQKLLDLLANIQKERSPNYPMGLHIDEMLIVQLGEYREERAVPELERISRFQLDAKNVENDHLQRNQQRILKAAQWALSRIRGEDRSES